MRSARSDLRALGIGAVAWATALAAVPARQVVVWTLLAAALAAAVRRSRTGATWVLAGAAAFASVLLHVEAVDAGPVPALVDRGASVRADLVLTSDPAPLPGRFGGQVVARAELREVVVATGRVQLRAGVSVRLPASAAGLARGSTLRVRGELRSAYREEEVAQVQVRGDPEVLAGPGPVTGSANALRAAIKDAVADRGPGPAALVPALVDGDDGGLPDDVVSDFRTTGLTHLLAVSGTNLTLVVGFLLAVAVRVGVRASGLLVTGGLGVVGFVLLAGPEPSVLRAAAMGTVALLGMTSGGRRRGVRALGLGVLVLVVLDPWLARAPGFALSVVATAGILLLAPGWRDALARWLPRWVAELIAVPLAAQIACTPIVAALSGEVSLVAVAANLVAAPLVAPATVLGLLGGVVGLAVPPLGELVATPAAWCASGLIRIAEQGAGLPVPAVSWSRTPAAITVLALGCAVLGRALGPLLARRGATLAVCALVTVTVLVPVPVRGWPPDGWVLVVCDVGQGDALAIRVAAEAAVIVDAGPDPRTVDRCLRRLGVTAVPVLVLSHFHADHVDGLAGVLRGRRVGEVLVSPLADPAGAAVEVRRTAQEAGVPVRVARAGESTQVGPVRWQVLGPLRERYDDSASPPNDASVVLLVETTELRVLLLGDQERPSQADLRRGYPGLRADVLKVAHHGSSKQDERLITGLGARLAVVSAGRDNDYGHPAASTLRMLERAGVAVHRTDLEGDVAVLLDGRGRLGTAHLGPGR